VSAHIPASNKRSGIEAVSVLDGKPRSSGTDETILNSREPRRMDDMDMDAQRTGKPVIEGAPVVLRAPADFPRQKVLASNAADRYSAVDVRRQLQGLIKLMHTGIRNAPPVTANSTPGYLSVRHTCDVQITADVSPVFQHYLEKDGLS
jgi:hypothetical protein